MSLGFLVYKGTHSTWLRGVSEANEIKVLLKYKMRYKDYILVLIYLRDDDPVSAVTKRAMEVQRKRLLGASTAALR